MSSNPCDFTASPETELPPLLALPLEIKQDIFAYLHDSREPTLAILRRTHSSFYRIIPRSELRSKVPRQLGSQLLRAEARYPYLLPPGHYTCFECLCVLPRNSFSDNETHKGKGLGSVKAHQRFCLSCGVTRGRYARNTKVPVGGITRPACYSCGHFLRDVPFEKPLKVTCQAHLKHLAGLEKEMFEAKVGWLEDLGGKDEAEALKDWWYYTWCRRGRVAGGGDEADDDWLPDETLPTPGQDENMSILAYLEERWYLKPRDPWAGQCLRNLAVSQRSRVPICSGVSGKARSQT